MSEETPNPEVVALLVEVAARDWVMTDDEAHTLSRVTQADMMAATEIRVARQDAEAEEELFELLEPYFDDRGPAALEEAMERAPLHIERRCRELALILGHEAGRMSPGFVIAAMGLGDEDDDYDYDYEDDEL